MKNRKKIIILLVIFIVAAIIFVSLPRLKFVISLLRNDKGDRLKDNPTSNESIVDIGQNPLDVILEHGSESVETSHGEDVGKILQDTASDANIKDEKKEESLSNFDEKSVNLEDIALKYNGLLKDVQNKFQGELDSLMANAYDEYLEKGKKSGFSLGLKYLGIGSDLEESCDAEVEGIFKDMERELLENDLDTSLMKDLRSYYEAFKNQEKERIMNKARELM